MTADDIRRLVLDALADVAPEADEAALDPAAPITEQLDIDSMDFLDFMTGVAERTGIEIPEADYGKVTTLDGCVAYLAAAMAAA